MLWVNKHLCQWVVEQSIWKLVNIKLVNISRCFMHRIQEPRTEVVTDTQDAKKQWRSFLRSNQSIIVEVFKETFMTSHNIFWSFLSPFFFNCFKFCKSAVSSNCKLIKKLLGIKSAGYISICKHFWPLFSEFFHRNFFNSFAATSLKRKQKTNS